MSQHEILFSITEDSRDGINFQVAGGKAIKILQNKEAIIAIFKRLENSLLTESYPFNRPTIVDKTVADIEKSLTKSILMNINAKLDADITLEVFDKKVFARCLERTIDTSFTISDLTDLYRDGGIECEEIAKLITKIIQSPIAPLDQTTFSSINDVHGFKQALMSLREIDSISEPRMIQIWSEGFRATGQASGALFHISIQASNLKEACIKYAEIDKKFASYFNKDQMTLWGCKLFDNEQDARKSFG